MGTSYKGVATAALALTLGLTAFAAHAAPAFMSTGSRTTQPVGHYEFCQRNRAECIRKASAGAPVELTRALWSRMIEINNAVNTSIMPMTDYELWGREEVWSYPRDGIGDCEDYVLEKRRALIAIGVPAGDLLITVVRQPNGDGHAVLTVRTSLGEFVLDNLEPRILAWHDTKYTFLKRQSERDPGAWISIDDDRLMAVGSVR